MDDLYRDAFTPRPHSLGFRNDVCCGCGHAANIKASNVHFDMIVIWCERCRCSDSRPRRPGDPPFVKREFPEFYPTVSARGRRKRKVA